MHRTSEVTRARWWRALSESQVKSLTTMLSDPPFASLIRVESRVAEKTIRWHVTVGNDSRATKHTFQQTLRDDPLIIRNRVQTLRLLLSRNVSGLSKNF